MNSILIIFIILIISISARQNIQKNEIDKGLSSGLSQIVEKEVNNPYLSSMMNMHEKVEDKRNDIKKEEDKENVDITFLFRFNTLLTTISNSIKEEGEEILFSSTFKCTPQEIIMYRNSFLLELFLPVSMLP